MNEASVVVPDAAAVRQGVIDWLRLPATEYQPVDGAQSRILDMACTAARSFVATLPIASAGAEAADRVRMGTIMLASRLHRRRNSPGGIEAMTDAGATYVARNDADVARLLGIDAYVRPVVG